MPVNIFDLAEELYVSYSTIEKELISVKKLINGNLVMVRHKGSIHVEGSELDKRKFIKTMILDSDAVQVDKMLEAYCSEIQIDIVDIKNIITHSLEKYSIYASDYALFNIFLHFYTLLLQFIESGKAFI